MSEVDLTDELPTNRVSMRSDALARRARDRLAAIKTFCKTVSNNGAGTTLERKQQAQVRSNIYNSVTPALVAMHEQLCALEQRTRRLKLANLTLGVAMLAAIGAATLLIAA